MGEMEGKKEIQEVILYLRKTNILTCVDPINRFILLDYKEERFRAQKDCNWEPGFHAVMFYKMEAIFKTSNHKTEGSYVSHLSGFRD
jgi:hypothetical protein